MKNKTGQKAISFFVGLPIPALRFVLAAQIALASAAYGITGTVERVVVQEATDAELDEAIIPNNALVRRSADPKDLRIGDGYTVGGISLWNFNALTSPPSSFPHDIYLNHHHVRLDGSYSLNAEAGRLTAWYGTNAIVQIIASATEADDVLLSVEADGTNMVFTVAATNDDVTVEVCSDLANPVWESAAYGFERLTELTVKITIPAAPVGEMQYVRVLTDAGDVGMVVSIPLSVPSLTVGGAEVTAASISNWLAAFEWGDHASAGYLTGFTETDGVFTASAAYGISATDTQHWATAYGWGDHADGGYLTAETDSTALGQGFATTNAAGEIATNVASGWSRWAATNDIAWSNSAGEIVDMRLRGGAENGGLAFYEDANDTFQTLGLGCEGLFWRLQIGYGGDSAFTGPSVPLWSRNRSEAEYNENFARTNELFPMWMGGIRGDGIVSSNGTLAVESNLVVGTGIVNDSAISNWDAAYGWGDHAAEGYIPSDGAIVIGEGAVFSDGESYISYDEDKISGFAIDGYVPQNGTASNLTFAGAITSTANTTNLFLRPDGGTNTVSFDENGNMIVAVDGNRVLSVGTNNNVAIGNYNPDSTYTFRSGGAKFAGIVQGTKLIDFDSTSFVCDPAGDSKLANLTTTGTLVFTNLPTATNGLASGTVWSDGGTLKVMP